MTESEGGPDLSRIGSWIFTGFGALIVLIGIIVAVGDPAGFFAILFGAVFIGAGRLIRRVFVLPEGKREVVVSGYTTATQGMDGRRGTLSRSVRIEVDEDATEAEVASARRAWLSTQWAQRPDWVTGLIRADDARTGGLAMVGAGLWSVSPFTLTLSCVHRWEETTGTGDNRRTQVRRDTLWMAMRASLWTSPDMATRSRFRSDSTFRPTSRRSLSAVARRALSGSYR